MSNETELLQTTDATKWAREFTRINAEKGIVVDEGWMITWFANAIETGRAAGERAPEPRGKRPLNEIEVGVLLRGLGGSSTDALWLTEQLNKLIEAHRAERAPEPRYQGLNASEIRLTALRECRDIADECTEQEYGPYGAEFVKPESAKHISAEINELIEAVRLAAAEPRGTTAGGEGLSDDRRQS